MLLGLVIMFILMLLGLIVWIAIIEPILILSFFGFFIACFVVGYFAMKFLGKIDAFK